VTENLIEHYHNKKLLWDEPISNKHFMNLELKDATWQRISAALNLPTSNIGI